MSQQGQWKASALAATFSSNAGFTGTAWGAARPPMHINTGIGFGQAPHMSGMLHDNSGHLEMNSHLGEEQQQQIGRRQKRKASSEDESMDSLSPSPEPIGGTGRRIRSLAEHRRYAVESENPVAAVINSTSSPFNRRHSNIHNPTRTQTANASSSGHTAASAMDGRKRTRMDFTAPSEVSLDKLLEPLEDKDLRSLLDALIAQNPHLAAQVRQMVPKPTVNSACSQLVRLERRLQAAFPYSKAGPVSDDYAYHRVKPALEELRDTIVMYLNHFTHYSLASSRAGSFGDSGATSENALAHPAEWFDLLAQATDVAMRMPKWDKKENNEVRRDTLRQLADGWLRAIIATARWTEEGHIVGRDMVTQWAQQLDHFYSNSGEPTLVQPAIQVFQQSFGHHHPKGAGRRTLETSV
ncbi:Tethering factor for nuclear proteasome sts1 [Dipsacomyces acuminosporus]|nr:Tethering factor for nuclear proteasome sts1 [Dipsacomyces acuminosporus]